MGPIVGLCVCCLAVPPFEELVRLFDYDAAQPLHVEVARTSTVEDGLTLDDLSYASPKGGRVTAYLVRPAGDGPFAGLLFMHGGNGNRSSLLPGAKVLARTGAVCLLIDSPLNGARAVPGQPLADYTAPERTRAALIQTVVDLRRGVDLLCSRKEIDPQRLGYIGASFGGTIGGVLAGVEHRVKAYCLLVGIGSLGDFLLESPHPTPRKARTALGSEQIRRSLAILDDVQPIHYIGHAAPSALLFQNGRQDAFMPVRSVQRFFEAASEPKKLLWYDAGHGLDAEAFLDRAAWLQEQIGLGPMPAEAVRRLGRDKTD